MKLVRVLAMAASCLALDVNNPIFDGFPVENLLGTHFYIDESDPRESGSLAHRTFNASVTFLDKRTGAKNKPLGKYECPPNSGFCIREVISNDNGASAVTLFLHETAEPSIELEEDSWGSEFRVEYPDLLIDGARFLVSMSLVCLPEEHLTVYKWTHLVHVHSPLGHKVSRHRGLDAHGHEVNRHRGLDDFDDDGVVMRVDWSSQSFCRDGKYVDPHAPKWSGYLCAAIFFGLVGHLVGSVFIHIRRVGFKQCSRDVLAYLNYLWLIILDKSRKLASSATKTRHRRSYNSLSDD